MRTENEMMNLIINYAKNDNRIRAVYMNGSRTNPNVCKDIFQDYDIVYVVTETASFLRDENWINYFGELLIIQEPDKNDQACGIQRDFVKSYSYLMLFTDGNRIDLHIETDECMRKRFVSEKLTISLLDKDHILPAIDPPSDSDYHILMPTEAMYAGCTNNFWWCLQNVAKGIWRDELPYAKGMFERIVRDELDNMVSWWIGSRHDFQVSAGKMGKYFKNYLPASYWSMYEDTYSTADNEPFWDSIFAASKLFRTLAEDVAASLSFTYLIVEDRNMMKYLYAVRNLPSDAKKIFI
jgi:aminoglycoside 6-adenylyltransferase